MVCPLIGSMILCDLSLSSDPELKLRLQSYEDMGRLLFNTPEVARMTQIVDEIDRFSSTDTPPFVFLEGSSGVGKTQMAFNLAQAYSNTDRKLFYLIATPVVRSTQKIYKVFLNPSHSLHACVEADLKSLSSNVSALTIQNYDLFTFGFVAKLLEVGMTSGPPQIFSIGKKSIAEVWQLIPEQKPIIVLDE